MPMVSIDAIVNSCLSHSTICCKVTRLKFFGWSLHNCCIRYCTQRSTAWKVDSPAWSDRLTGIIFTPEVMPSNKLVDQFVEMLESGVLVYLPPDACTSRAQEIQCVKKDAAISLDGAGTLRLQNKSADPVVDAGTEVKLRAR